MMDATRIADTTTGLRHVFVHDLVLNASIGVYPSEHEAPQRIRINIDLAVIDEGASVMPHLAIGRDDLERVVDYEAVTNAARAIVASGHVQLVETLAERIAASIVTDVRVVSVRVRVEKLDVFPDAGSVGVEIERRRS
jgi:dihydroneopterin aldolase